MSSSIGRIGNQPAVELGPPVWEIGYSHGQVAVEIVWEDDPETRIGFPLSVEEARRIAASLEKAANGAEEPPEKPTRLH